MSAKDRTEAAVPNPLSVPDEPPVSWIEKDPAVCGGDARVRGTRIPVWGIVEWRTLGLSDAEILEHHPDLTQSDLDAAWTYHREHPEEIEQAIRENEEA